MTDEINYPLFFFFIAWLSLLLVKDLPPSSFDEGLDWKEALITLSSAAREACREHFFFLTQSVEGSVRNGNHWFPFGIFASRLILPRWVHSNLTSRPLNGSPFKCKRKWFLERPEEKSAKNKNWLSAKRCLSQESPSNSPAELLGAWSNICEDCGQTEMQ